MRLSCLYLLLVLLSTTLANQYHRNFDVEVVSRRPDAEDIFDTFLECSDDEISELENWLLLSFRENAQTYWDTPDLVEDSHLRERGRNNEDTRDSRIRNLGVVRRGNQSIKKKKVGLLRERSLSQEWSHYKGTGGFTCGSLCEPVESDRDRLFRQELSRLSSEDTTKDFEVYMESHMTNNLRSALVSQKILQNVATCMADSRADLRYLQVDFSLVQ